MKKNAVKIQLVVGLCALLLSFITTNPLTAQNIIGGATGDPSAVLDLRSSSKGLLLPRLTTEARSAIANPAEGLLIYNTSLGCVEINLGNSSSPDWVCMLALSGRLASLDCDGVTHNGTVTVGEEASGVSSVIPYTGGSGGFYDAQAVPSTGVTGLTARLSAGAFASGSGSLTYTITGTPSGEGTATFVLNIGGQSCTLNRTVVEICGAYVAAGVWKEFMCHNLGANTNADPLTPSWELIGNYFQWGRNPTCFGRDGIDGTNPCSSPVYGASGPWGSTTANDNAGAITGWSTTPASDDAWRDDVKTSDDPCPAGFRIPTQAQWNGLVNPSLNTRTFVGTWGENSTNYSNGLRFGNTLFLPAAGSRDSNQGWQGVRGSRGDYWSSTSSADANARHLGFESSDAGTGSIPRNLGLSLRCIAE